MSKPTVKSPATAIPVVKSPATAVPIGPDTQSETAKTLPALIEDDMSDYSGMGFEDVQSTDLALPYWKLLQKGSYECDREAPEYIKGAVAGLWLDTISHRMYKNLVVVPCKYITNYNERKAGMLKGGFVKNWGTDRSILDKCHRDEKTGRDTTDHGTEISTDNIWFCLIIGGTEVNPLIVDDAGIEIDLHERAVITFRGTSQRASKKWVSQAQALRLKRSDGSIYQAPIFAMTYRLDSTGTKNDKGSWQLPVINPAGWVKDYPEYIAIKQEAIDFSKFANSLKAVNIAPPVDDDSRETYRDDRQPKTGEQAPLDDEIPF